MQNTRPYRIAEDDDLRSRHIWGLIQKTSRTENSFDESRIPKVIMQFWHNLEQVPEDVQECLDSWESLKKQGFKRVFFDDDGAKHFISKRLGNSYKVAFERCYHPAMRCDYFRLCYIFICGGFYVDADEMYQGTECIHLFNDNRLKIQPLCYDKTTGTMIKPDVFFSKRAYSPDWIFYVNNNPLIAPANHPVIRLALDRATSILLSCVVNQPEIQSTTGPGNLTASLVRHSVASKYTSRTPDFLILPKWEAISISPWPLSYRNDDRNWRLWNSSKATKDTSK